MTDDQLLTFLEVARLRSVTRAADALRIGQPTASERLRALEKEVGAPLVTRRGRGIVLTQAGTAFLPHAQRARQVLARGVAAARAAGSGAGGRVRLAASVTAGTYLVAPALVAFRQAHDGVAVEVRSAHSPDALGLLLDDDVDLALSSGPLLHPQVARVARGTGPLVLVARAGGPWAKARRMTAARLREAPLLVGQWGPAYRRFLEDVRGEGFVPPRWIEVSPVDLVKAMLKADAGVAVLPAIAVREELDRGVFVELAYEDGRLPGWSVVLSRRADVPLDGPVAALASALTASVEGLSKGA